MLRPESARPFRPWGSSFHRVRPFGFSSTSGNGKGSVVVFSAGNYVKPRPSAGVVWPATLVGQMPIIAVAATNEWDQLKTRASRDGEADWGSETGPEVTVAAPGVRIPTTDIQGKDGADVGDYYKFFNGTSAAAAHVAAVAALLLAKCPGLTAAQVRGTIETTADHTVALANGATASYGRLNAAAALAQPCVSQPSPSPPR